MSWQAVADVLENSPSYGADRLVELAIAERADELGAGSWGSMEDVARRANLLRFHEVIKPSEGAPDSQREEFERLRGNACRSARRSVRNLEDLGRVEHYETTLKGVRVYRICMGRTQCPPPDTVSGVEQSGEDKVSSLPGHGVRSGGTTCPVPPDTVSSKPSLNPLTKSQDESKKLIHQISKKQQEDAAEKERQLADLRAQTPKPGPLRDATDRAILALERDLEETHLVEVEVDHHHDRVLAVAA